MPQPGRHDAKLGGALRQHSARIAAAPGLERRILRALDRAGGEVGAKPWPLARLGRFLAEPRQWLVGAISGAALAGAAALAVIMASLSDENERLFDEPMNALGRSLMADRPTDITFSDRDAVGPWLVGHADVAPPVPDLSAKATRRSAGAPISPAASAWRWWSIAVVYRHSGHVIDLFVWSPYEVHPTVAAAKNGYHFFL